ncbi:MAG TPA: response regulator [Ruminiclostridium sp.]|nr:response regulator [Ruminiclostridium sp.]
MFKVLLVDDEPMAIEALKIAADWEELGFTICGECGNGEEALKAVSKLKPDLVVTDIRMPVMDGLELIKKVCEENKQGTMFILVSGYDEFEYAKKAIQFGIRHYVLKPVFKDEFSAVLLEVLEKLKQEKAFNKIAIDYTNTDIGSLLRKYLTGSLSEDILKESLPAETRYKDAKWIYACFGTGQVWDTWEFSKEDMSADSLGTLKDMMNTSLGDVFMYPLFNNMVLEGLVICSTSQMKTGEIMETLSLHISRLFGEGFYLGVGTAVRGLSNLKDSMYQSRKAIDYRFFSPPGSIIYYENIKDFSLNYSLKGIAKIEDLYEALEGLDEKRITGALTDTFSDFRREFTAPEIIKMYVVNIIYKSISIVRSVGGNTDEIPLLNSISAILAKSLIINEMESMVKEYCSKFCEYAQGFKYCDRNSDMKKVEEYIKGNYTRNLTIREISKKLYMHPNYLGHQINKWFGCSFNEYLHSLRMEEAKKLITDSNLKVHEIAEKLGYSSYSNFLDQFVKRFEVKPSDFRNSKN